MKKVIASVLTCIIIFLFTFNTYADGNITENPNIKIVVNGSLKSYSDIPIIVNGRTMLPFREILSDLGVQNDNQHIIWNGYESSIKVVKDSIQIYLKVGSDKAAINGVSEPLDTVPINYKNKAYIPVRFIAQCLQKRVE